MIARFIIEVAAVLGAAAVLWILTGRRAGALPALTAVVAAVVLVVELPGFIREANDELQTATHGNARTPARVSCLREHPGLDRAAVERIARQMPSTARYVIELEPGRRTSGWGELCTEFVLLPRLPVASRAKAQWVVHVGRSRSVWLTDLRHDRNAE